MLLSTAPRPDVDRAPRRAALQGAVQHGRGRRHIAIGECDLCAQLGHFTTADLMRGEALPGVVDRLRSVGGLLRCPTCGVFYRRYVDCEPFVHDDELTRLGPVEALEWLPEGSVAAALRDALPALAVALRGDLEHADLATRRYARRALDGIETLVS